MSSRRIFRFSYGPSLCHVAAEICSAAEMLQSAENIGANILLVYHLEMLEMLLFVGERKI